MKSLLKSLFSLSLLLILSSGAATAQDTDMSDMTIAEIAQQNDQLKTLVAAASAVGMVDALQGDGPLTVFAPTDRAFQELPEGVLQALTKSDNRQTLIDILNYHIAEGQVAGADIQRGIGSASNGMFSATTLNGDFTASLADGGVVIEDAAGRNANVVTADIMASNGVIHIIDAVLLPENVSIDAILGNEDMDDDMDIDDNGMDDDDGGMNDMDGTDMGSTDMDGSDMRSDRPDYSGMNLQDRADIQRPDMDLTQVAADNGNFTTLISAVEAADLTNMLRSNGEFTVFAPSDAAFQALPADARNSLMDGNNTEMLKRILSYHVIASEITAQELMQAIEKKNGFFRIQTLGTGSLIASMEDGNVILTDSQGNKARITQTDVAANNGIIHVIDAVAIPRDVEMTTASDMDDMR